MLMVFVPYVCLQRQAFEMQVKVTFVTPVPQAWFNIEPTRITKISTLKRIFLDCQTVAWMEWVSNFLRQFSARFMYIKHTWGAAIARTMDVFVA